MQRKTREGLREEFKQNGLEKGREGEGKRKGGSGRAELSFVRETGKLNFVFRSELLVGFPNLGS